MGWVISGTPAGRLPASDSRMRHSGLGVPEMWLRVSEAGARSPPLGTVTCFFTKQLTAAGNLDGALAICLVKLYYELFIYRLI